MLRKTQSVWRSSWRWSCCFLAISTFFVTLGLLPLPSNADSPVVLIVLPFKDFSESGEKPIASSLTQDISLELVRVGGLKVQLSLPGTGSEDVGLSELGAVYGAELVLEGSVRVHSNQIRATAQLIRIEDGRHLWIASYDESLDQSANLAAEIANGVAEAIVPIGFVIAFDTGAGVAGVSWLRTDPSRYAADRQSTLVAGYDGNN